MKNRGISIIQVLVAAAIMGILAVAFTQFISGSMKAQKNVQNSIDFDILKNSINMVLNSQNCQSPIQDTTGKAVKLILAGAPDASGSFLSSPVAVERLTHGGGNLVTANQDLGGGLKVTKLEVSSAVPDGPNENHMVGTVSTPFKPYLVNLVLEATKAEGSLGKKVLSQIFVIRMLANQGSIGDTVNRIERCVGGGEDTAPPGTVRIDGAGAPFYFDINYTATAKPYHQAILDCHSRGMRLCTSGQWISACLKNPGGVIQGLNPILSTEVSGTDPGATSTGKAEWVDGLTVMNALATTAGTSQYINTCTQTSIGNPPANHFRYRCCK